MRHLKEYLQVGQIRKSHGLDGMLRLTLMAKTLHAALKTDHFFVDESGQKLPLFIEWIEGEGEDYFIKFEDIDNPQDAGQLAAAALYMDKKVIAGLMEGQADNDMPLDPVDLVGYRLIDLNSGLSFEIMDILEFPQQIMARVDIEGREVLLPLSEGLIQLTDHENRHIEGNFPEGIFEL